MEFNANEWLQLAMRWLHVFAGILWIGQTFFFSWLDRRLSEAERRESSPAQVWMVHSGGFYVAERRGLDSLPRQLYWFRWEAALTWLSGVVLLVMVYYLGGSLLDADVADISLGAGVAVGVGVLVAGWFLYDLIWRSPLGQAETTAVVVSFLLLVAASYGLSSVFSGRAAYIHVGALMGTIMAANVWLHILPAQNRMLAAARAGQPHDAALAARAKQRTTHNTYMVVPVVFIMLSSHYPVATYGQRYNWAILAGLILVGWAAARILRSH